VDGLFGRLGELEVAVSARAGAEPGMQTRVTARLKSCETLGMFFKFILPEIRISTGAIPFGNAHRAKVPQIASDDPVFLLLPNIGT
jgi:hypothetical protein